MNPWIAIGALGVVGIGIPLGMMAMSAMLRPSVPEDSKRAVYESGEVPTGTTRIRFNIQYYMVALLFVVFDIETVLIFPWVVIYRFGMTEVLAEMSAQHGTFMAYAMTYATVFGPMLVFIVVLALGLAWAWRNGAVEWARSPRAERGAHNPQGRGE